MLLQSEYIKLIIILLMIGLFLGIYILLFYYSYRLRKSTYMKVMKYLLVVAFTIAGLGTIGYVAYVQPKLKVMDMVMSNSPDLYSVLVEEEATIDLTEYIKEQWEFTAEEIEFIQSIYTDLFVEVIVDQHLEPGENIKATFYETPIVANGINLADQINPPVVRLDDGIFTVGTMEEQGIVLALHEPILTMRQFNRDYSAAVNVDNFDVQFGERVLYLELPPNVTVKAEEKFISYK